MSITLEQDKALRPGDKVRIIKIDNGRPRHWNHDGMMDKYAGQIVTINKFLIWDGEFDIKEDTSWSWNYTDIDSIIKTFEQWPKENPHLIVSSRCYGKQDLIDAYMYSLRDVSATKALENSIYGRHAFDEKPLIQIDKVIFNDPATIVFWKDGTKTVVKAGTDEYFDKEKGLAMAISKKVLGNKGNYYNTFKKHGAIDDSGEIFVPLRLLKECKTFKEMKALIAFMEG